PFSGINVIFAGDMGQLRPVNGTALYAYNLVKNLHRYTFEMVKAQCKLFGAFLWWNLTHIVQLRKNVRAASDAEFMSLLDQVHGGKATMVDSNGKSDFDILKM
ncbi:hypothetical protein BKA83DRAFT_4061218, partial [Pisolithus microcarpus]